MEQPRIGITLGDPAGIGPEITAKAIASSGFQPDGLTLIGNKRNFEDVVKMLRIDNSLFSGIQFIDIPSEPIKMGKVSKEAGRVAIQCIEMAASLALSGRIQGVCTAPISKEAIILSGSRYIDHTTMLQTLTGSRSVTTVFESGRLRIIFMTKHVPLKEAVGSVTKENLVQSIRQADYVLKCLGSERRRIVVAALNPHAGEQGILGNEEIDEIAPAVNEMRDLYDVHGPLAADSVFHLAASGEYDIVLSLYHDQGHIAAKMLDFNGTVSMNIGLPFLRTSVDHGTAFDIAGRGTADATSMHNAIVKCMVYSAKYLNNYGVIDQSAIP